MRSVRPNRVSIVMALLLLTGTRGAAHDVQHSEAPGALTISGVPPGNSTAPVASGELLRAGATLYSQHCSSCHGADLAGGHGAPSLLDAGGAAVDFYVATGRMPLAITTAGAGDGERTMADGTQAFHMAPHFTPRQIAALDAYVDAHARSIPIPPVRLEPAELARGRLLFEDNCQACHGAAAQGATVGTEWTAPPLQDATPTQIGEAIRIGPGVMPHFAERQLSVAQIDAIATYVRYLATTPQTYGGAVLDYVGPTAEGVVGAIAGVGSLFWVIYFTGTKADGRRLDERD